MCSFAIAVAVVAVVAVMRMRIAATATKPSAMVMNSEPIKVDAAAIVSQRSSCLPATWF